MDIHIVPEIKEAIIMKKKLFRRVLSAFLAALCLAGFVLMGGNARA